MKINPSRRKNVESKHKLTFQNECYNYKYQIHFFFTIKEVHILYIPYDFAVSEFCYSYRYNFEALNVRKY